MMSREMKHSGIEWIGEIPFTREFYKYVAPRKSDEIFAHLQELEQQESALMAKILNKQ